MAYPPPVLPTNRTDATPQGPGTHVADHNGANLAINDIVAHLRSAVDTVVDDVPTLTTRVTALEGRMTAAETNSYIINGVTKRDHLHVRSNSQVVTTDANGRIAIPFSTPMPTTVFQVVAWCGDITVAGGPLISLGQFQRPNAGGFFVDARKHDNTPYANGALRVDYVATGLA